MTWQIMLRPGDSPDGASDLSSRVISLDVVEEDVTRSSRSVYCDHCRVVGWSSHPLCRKRYHFIIRSRGDTKACSRCGITQNFSEGSNCKWCSLALDIEDWVYSQLKTTLTSFTVSSIPTALLISCLSTGGKVALFFLLVVPLWTFGTGLQKKKTYKVDACSLLDLVVEWIRELKSPSPRAVLSQINPLVSNVPNDSVAIPLQILPLL
ncbi:PREDICTED: PHD finger protein At1g33420-like [Camelina sativa]|uniref:PHD finger protein At1g33420-like n=1 Tax=Camelina sativa TaxID=90675 RepID=A0ABM1Q8X7_CAMSA|nr:PREDICTED: PHD finger protein At1g33420-like [Camelina sativa]